MSLLPEHQEPSCSHALSAHHRVVLLVQTFLENVVCASTGALFQHDTGAESGEQ